MKEGGDISKELKTRMGKVLDIIRVNKTITRQGIIDIASGQAGEAIRTLQELGLIELEDQIFGDAAKDVFTLTNAGRTLLKPGSHSREIVTILAGQEYKSRTP